jgi:hypothetical protein
MDDSTSRVELVSSNPETNAAVAAAPPLQQTSQNLPALFSVPGEKKIFSNFFFLSVVIFVFMKKGF